MEPQSYLIPHVHADRAGLPRLLQARPAGEGRASEAGPGADTAALRRAPRNPRATQRLPPGSPGRWRQAPVHTRLATNALSLMNQTPRWDRVAPSSRAGRVERMAGVQAHTDAHTHVHTVTRTHMHAPDTISHHHQPGYAQAGAGTSSWGARDCEGMEGWPLLHFLTHNRPPAPLLQGKPQGWATEQTPVVTAGCAGSLSQGLGAHTPRGCGWDEEHGAELGPEQQASGCLHVHRAHAGRDMTGPLQGSGVGSAHLSFAFSFCLYVLPRPRPTPQS